MVSDRLNGPEGLQDETRAMNYLPPLTAEESAARLTMPKMPDGTIVGLLYLDNPADVERMEPRWRSFCKETPKHLWPTWVGTWSILAKQRNR